MNRRKWFWLGVPVVLAIVASIALLTNAYLSISTSLLTTGTTGTKEEIPLQSRANESAKIQQMIDGGQFALSWSQQTGQGDKW